MRQSSGAGVASAVRLWLVRFRQPESSAFLDLLCRARAGLEPAKPARDAARALGNC